MTRRGSLLHVGCGGDPLPEWLRTYDEVRLDVDPCVNADITADMRELGDIGPFDGLYCNHALEHVFTHEVAGVLGGFFRVLKPGGFVVLFVPDLQGVSPTSEVLFQAPCGPITGHDLMYGHREYTAKNKYMAHKTGFTAETLHAALVTAGFSEVSVKRLENYALMGAAKK